VIMAGARRVVLDRQDDFRADHVGCSPASCLRERQAPQNELKMAVAKRVNFIDFLSLEGLQRVLIGTPRGFLLSRVCTGHFSGRRR